MERLSSAPGISRLKPIITGIKPDPVILRVNEFFPSSKNLARREAGKTLLQVRQKFVVKKTWGNGARSLPRRLVSAKSRDAVRRRMLSSEGWSGPAFSGKINIAPDWRSAHAGGVPGSPRSRLLFR
jgi:hypothetical protein